MVLSRLPFWKRSKFVRELGSFLANPCLCRKEQATAGLFALRFTWTEAFDTAADVYHGVSAIAAYQI